MTSSSPSRARGDQYAPRATPALRRETAAHLVDHVIPPLPVRQWVLSVPKRLRWYLEREPHAVSAVLHILLRVIEAHLRATIPTASPRARLGAVSFVHRFGSALNRHVHLHCCIIDGLFDPGEDGQVRFLQTPVLTTDQMAAISSPARSLWAMLLARLFEALPLVCPNCGANTCLPAGRCASSPSSPMPPPSSRSSWPSVSHPGHPRSRPPADHRPGTRRPRRCWTGTLSLSPSSNSISVSPGSRRLLREAVPSAFVLPPSGMPPSPLQRAASAGNRRRARSLRHLSRP